MFKVRRVSVILVLSILCANCNLLFSFEKEKDAKSKPPWELRKLSSVLYEFLEAPDRDIFAKTHHIFYKDGRIRVYISLDPALFSFEEKKRLLSKHRIEVEKESQNLLRAIVPVDELVSLAKETLVLSIRLPDRPVAQGTIRLNEEEVGK